MSAKKPVEKKPIHDLLQEKDAFLTTSERFIEYFLRHTKAFISAAVVLAMIIVGTAFYFKYRDGAELKASEAYEQAMALSSTPDGSKAVMAALEKLRVDYQGRKAERLAGFSLIPLYDRAGDHGKALNLAQGLLQTLKPNEASLKPILLSVIGELSELTGDYNLSTKSCQALLAIPDNSLFPLKMDCRMVLGRVLGVTGQKDEAIAEYETVIREFPLTPHAFIAKSKLFALKDGLPEQVKEPSLDKGSAPAPVDSTGAGEPLIKSEGSQAPENTPSSGADLEAQPSVSPDESRAGEEQPKP